MPHAVISAPPELEEISQHFVPLHWSHDRTIIRLVDLYRSSRHDASGDRRVRGRGAHRSANANSPDQGAV